MANIIDKVRELQAAIREQYGVEAHIDISIYDTQNPHITKELANWIANELATRMKPEEILNYHNSQGDDGNHRWVRLTKNGFGFVAHY